MKHLKDYIGQKVCIVVDSLEQTEEILKLFYESTTHTSRHAAKSMYKPDETGKEGLCLWQGNISHAHLDYFKREGAEFILASEFLQEIYEIY